MKFNSKPVTLNTVLLLLALTVTSGIYYPSLFGSFILDDSQNIVHKHSLDIKDLSFDSLRHAALDGIDATPRPLAKLSFALNMYFFGKESALSFKIINLIIHLLNGLLVFAFVKLLIQLGQKRPMIQHSWYEFMPIIICSLWLLHPINVSAVAYSVQRMTSLSSLFTLVGLVLYLKARIEISKGNSSKLRLFVLIPLSVLLSVSTKEIGILLFVFLFVIEISFGTIEELRRSRELIVFHLLFFVIPTILAIIILGFNFDWVLGNYQWRDFTLEQRLLTQPRVIMLYLKMIVLPAPNDFSIFHDNIVLSDTIFSPWTTALSILAILLLFGVAFYVRRQRPFITFGILFYFVGHSIESTILSLEMVFEHRNYLPSLGIIIALTSLLLQSTLRKRLQTSVIAIAILFTAFNGYLHASIWKDSKLHILTMLANKPDSYRANLSYAITLLPYVVHDDKRYLEQVLFHCQRARELHDGEIQSHIITLKALAGARNAIDPSLYADMMERLSNKPFGSGSSNAIYMLSTKMKSSEHIIPTQHLKPMIEAAIANPYASHVMKSLLHLALFHINFYHKNEVAALENINDSLRLNPLHFDFRIALIEGLLAHGKFTEAQEHINYFNHSNMSFGYKEKANKLEKSLQQLRAHAVDAHPIKQQSD